MHIFNAEIESTGFCIASNADTHMNNGLKYIIQTSAERHEVVLNCKNKGKLFIWKCFHTVSCMQYGKYDIFRGTHCIDKVNVIQ